MSDVAHGPLVVNDMLLRQIEFLTTFLKLISSPEPKAKVKDVTITGERNFDQCSGLTSIEHWVL